MKNIIEYVLVVIGILEERKRYADMLAKKRIPRMFMSKIIAASKLSSTSVGAGGSKHPTEAPASSMMLKSVVESARLTTEANKMDIINDQDKSSAKGTGQIDESCSVTSQVRLDVTTGAERDEQTSTIVSALTLPPIATAVQPERREFKIRPYVILNDRRRAIMGSPSVQWKPPTKKKLLSNPNVVVPSPVFDPFKLRHGDPPRLGPSTNGTSSAYSEELDYGARKRLDTPPESARALLAEMQHSDVKAYDSRTSSSKGLKQETSESVNHDQNNASYIEQEHRHVVEVAGLAKMKGIAIDVIRHSFL